MPGVKISELPAATTPLAGTELLAIVQGGVTKQASADAVSDAVLDEFAASSGSSLVGFLQAGTGAVTRTAQTKLRESVSVKDFGAVGDGVTDDTAAIQAAISASSSKTLFWPAGAYLVKSPLTISSAVSWFFEGPTSPLAGLNPTTYIVKASTLAGDCLTFTGQSIVLDGVAIVGQPGNTGDGIVLRGNSPVVTRPFVTGMGRDGIRVGSDVAGSNVNGFLIQNARCVSNGRDGISISDASVNANAGSFINPICTQNGRHGFYGNIAALGVTIVCPLFEANTGYGAYLDSFFGYIGSNVILGGDLEANVAGNLYEAVANQNVFVGVSVQGKVFNTYSQGGSFTPIITGGTTAGTGTYTTQLGSYQIAGGAVNFQIEVSWTAHTGTGQLYLSLPSSVYAGAIIPSFIPVQITTTGLTYSAGAQPVMLVNKVGSRLQLYESNAGALSAISVPSSGSIYVSGSYPLAVPNFNYL